ncbi:MAG: RluA family pseudouridine synthase [Clostridia bacterium]|nr:RluA family pseudouridine synthase [Clostridia bacterium]
MEGERGDVRLFTADADKERLDVFLARSGGGTRSYMGRLIADGAVSVNGSVARAGMKLTRGDSVEVRFPAPRAVELRAQDIPLDVVYEDGDVIVVDKPQGMVVHPAAGNPDGTLVNAVMHRVSDLSGIGGELRPGIVHRIDKQTSGLIAVAKNDAAHNSLAAQFKEHSAFRVYVALVNGNLRADEGTVDAPIARAKGDRKKMAVVDGGRRAVTHWRVLRRYGEYTLLLLQLETGRTHQIRVHMAHIKHPVTGDCVYSGGKNPLKLNGQALHAALLELTQPSTGERLRLCAPLPAWFRSALTLLGERDADGIDAQVWPFVH